MENAQSRADLQHSLFVNSPTWMSTLSEVVSVMSCGAVIVNDEASFGEVQSVCAERVLKEMKKKKKKIEEGWIGLLYTIALKFGGIA
jgi:hypothetical protein